MLKACASDFRLFDDAFSSYPNCPECGRLGNEPTKQQEKCWGLYFREHHFSPTGVRLDAYKSLQERKVSLENELAKVQQEIERIENFETGLDMGVF